MYFFDSIKSLQSWYQYYNFKMLIYVDDSIWCCIWTKLQFQNVYNIKELSSAMYIRTLVAQWAQASS